MNTHSTSPQSPQQRIGSLDFVRGVAILGILFMNIHILALPLAAYVNPNFDGIASLTDKLVFSFEFLFVNFKFIGLFSMMFGIGMLLQGQSLDGRGLDSNQWLRRRLFWLAVFGLLHAAFVWPGDILFFYAVCGLILHYQRRHEAKVLLRRGAIFIGIGIGIITLFWLLIIALSNFPEIYNKMMAEFQLSPEALDEDIALWTSRDFLAQVAALVEVYATTFLPGLPIFIFWWCGGMMLIGMGLYKSGWFEQPRLRWRACLSGLLGLMSAGIGIAYYWLTDFNEVAAGQAPFVFLSGALLAPFYMNLLIVIADKVGALGRWLRQTGRMAFTLYLSQSILMVLLFRWIAPELYGQGEEVQLVLLVLGFSVLQVMFANLYLRFFRQGPLEKLWRWLSFRGLSRGA